MQMWNETPDENGKILCLLTPDELAKYPDGTSFECIDGTFAVKGRDYIDDDTRYGYLAYGLRFYQNEVTFD